MDRDMYYMDSNMHILYVLNTLIEKCKIALIEKEVERSNLNW